MEIVDKIILRPYNIKNTKDEYGGYKMEKIRMIIADDNKVFRETISEYFKSSENISIVAECGDGKEAISLIEQMNPDVVVLNVIMPCLDGIGVLEHFDKGESLNTSKFIMVSSFSHEAIIQGAINLGASYFMIKPFDISTLAQRIKIITADRRMYFIKNEFAEFEEATGTTGASFLNITTDEEFAVNSIINEGKARRTLEIEVTKLMHDIGIPAHIKGYQYIRDSIMMVINDQSVINSMTKVLYPYIAKQHHTTPSRVERAIRHAIEVAWNRGQIEIFNEVFGYSISNGRGKPTNGEFIAMIADRIRLMM